MKVTTSETFYHEDHGATLKHKCGKRIVTLPLLSFYFIFFVFWAFSFFGLSSFFPTWDNALIMKVITLLFTLQLKNYNSILRTRYDSI